MQAKDIMTTRVATVGPETSIRDIAKLLLERRISAVPVVDSDARVLGIVSEGDLMRRPETGAERHPSWWLSLVASPEETALRYIRTHGGHARDVMTKDLIMVDEEATLEDVAQCLETHRIKRVPVLRDGKLVGIVSRADLLHGIVDRQTAPVTSASDQAIKAAVEEALEDAGVRPTFVSVVVADGIVHLWGAAESDAAKEAAEIAAQGISGVKGVRNDLGVIPRSLLAMMWAE